MQFGDGANFVSVLCTDVFLGDILTETIKLEPGEYEYTKNTELIKSSGQKNINENVLYCYLYTVRGIAFDDMTSYKTWKEVSDMLWIGRLKLVGKLLHLWIEKNAIDKSCIRASVHHDSHIFDAHVSFAPNYLYDGYKELIFIVSTDYEDVKLTASKDIKFDLRPGSTFNTMTVGKYTLYLRSKDTTDLIKRLQSNVFETTGNIYVTRFKFIEEKVVIVSKKRHMASFNKNYPRSLYYKQGDEAVYYERKRMRIENVLLDEYEAIVAFTTPHDTILETESIWDSIPFVNAMYLHNH